VGIDSSRPSIEVARELYPKGEFRIGKATELVSQLGAERFDVVIVRHVLEHLPDFELAMEQAIAVSRRVVLFVFFLTPRRLPFGVRKLDAGLNGRFLYTNIYSQPAINQFLARTGLTWQWHYDVGTSRAAWLANETNCVLQVFRKPSITD
jgi:SAM-dependent methyltransferase